MGPTQRRVVELMRAAHDEGQSTLTAAEVTDLSQDREGRSLTLDGVHSTLKALRRSGVVVTVSENGGPRNSRTVALAESRR